MASKSKVPDTPSRRRVLGGVGAAAATIAAVSAPAVNAPALAKSVGNAAAPATPVTHYRTAKVDGVNIFYREAGPTRAPVVLLLHGFLTSSHMFRTPSV